MLYRSYAPAPPLSDFIERFWLCSDAPPHPMERILPSGTIEMVFNLRDEEIRIYDPSRLDRVKRLSGAAVSGTYGSFFVIDTLVHASMLGVHFRPGGAFPFLGMPACEMADTHVDLATLWGPSAAELRERLCLAVTPEERFSLLETALVRRLRQPPRRHGAVSFALDVFERADMEVSVRAVAQRVGLSQRRFIQVFAAEVGLTPKLYGRVRRFQRARRLVGKAAAPDWAGIAAACGYFDQSHLIRDFRAFSGLSPTAYLRQASERLLPNHLLSAGAVNFFQDRLRPPAAE
jgi:AraC-like DNA-binding protein